MSNLKTWDLKVKEINNQVAFGGAFNELLETKIQKWIDSNKNNLIKEIKFSTTYLPEKLIIIYTALIFYYEIPQ